MSEEATRSRQAAFVYPNPADARPVQELGAALHPEYSFLPEVRVPLVEPIKVGGVTVSEVTLRRPKVKDNKYMNAVKGNDSEKGLKFIAHLSGLAPEEFDELDQADVALLGEWLEVFTSARKTI